jgi:DNA modification methylase
MNYSGYKYKVNDLSLIVNINERNFMPKPPLKLETTTLWEYPSQNYGEGGQGDTDYPGATPSYIIWNLLKRYTKPKDLVVDPMAGSGTTLDVARDLKRRALGYDINTQRKDVFNVDARELPLEDEKADFVFIDPPYSDHIKYSGKRECIGEISAQSRKYYKEMEKVIAEIDRVLRPERYMALYVSDSYEKGKPFMPIGFELFSILRKYFVPVDIVCVVRHNAKLKRNNWHTAAVEHNYFLRGFNYLFIMYKEKESKRRYKLNDRRKPREVEKHLQRRRIKGKKRRKKPKRRR